MPVFYHGKANWTSRARDYVSGFFDGIWQDLNAPTNERQSRTPPRDLYRQDDRIPPPVQKPARNDALLKLRQSYNERANDLAKQLAEGKLTVAQWQNDMARELRIMHTGSRVAGAGGFGALGPEDMAVTEEIIREQRAYLNRWSDDLSQQDTLSADAIAARARLYGTAANTTFDKAEVAAMGMPALPVYPGEDSSCMVNCKCHWDIRKVSDGYEAYWKLGASEHCPQCLARARTWNPLRIRNGKIESYSRAGLFT